MRPQSRESHTYVFDCKDSSLVSAVIRPAGDVDREQLTDIGRTYMGDCENEGSRTFVLTTSRILPETVEGALQVKPGKFHAAPSLCVEGVDVAPDNMSVNDSRALSKVGTRLIEHAVQISREMGCGGRIHLTSRDSGSDRFYESLKFGDDGLRKDRDGTYYLPRKVAPRFLKRIEEELKNNYNLVA